MTNEKLTNEEMIFETTFKLKFADEKIKTKKIGNIWICVTCINNQFLSGIGETLPEAYADLEKKTNK